ncbi:hypothetical protein E1262_22005 [Jiangella aurantiaca]|uniref:Uncharacterized protein n=1 Tax=Jiangella aurantiaca TaxID=2530373 RepID=A0A4R5A6K0_9ACTN|nr:hypothetical protein [Jiangella aurantiaca]TDD66429.1 hypothetical protein E1262_22005 [Jiangella aurantiaca]
MNRVTVAVVAASAAVAACGDTTGAVDGPVLTSGSAAYGGYDAQVFGEVVLDGDCMLLDGRLPVVWPGGTTWQADPGTVALPGGTRVEPGRAVNGSGGYVGRDQVESRAGQRSPTRPRAVPARTARSPCATTSRAIS